MSRTMLRMLCLLLLHFCTVKSLPDHYVMLGDSITLSCGEDCVDCALTYKGYDGRKNNRLALDRFQLADDGSSVTITRAEYHDKGWYMWTCGGDTIQIKLDVPIPTEVSAAEGGNATLHCLTDTDEESVHWQKLLNGTLVDLPQTGRNFTHGKDLLLQPADQGIYGCSGKDSRGEPKFSRVTVTKEASPGMESPTSSTPALWVVIVIVILVSLCVGVRLGGNPPGGNPPGGNPPGCISRAIFWIQGRPTPGASDQIRMSSLDPAETEQLSPSVPDTAPVEEEQKCSSVISYSE